ncbi:MAG: enolase-phosphatase E1 [Nitrospiraceae bacterium]|jgi:enolase-phosphatase E1|nr:MAG: enolase-phosphatase E1 [Nitrospiraceae bacterium]
MTIRCVLTDIEGTIIPVAFVREVLFPYAQRRLATFLREHHEDPAVLTWATLCQDTLERELGLRPAYEDLHKFLARWIEEDRKHMGLKALQGMIWEEGYQTGAFTPELYKDVAPTFIRWRNNGIRLATFSSGSEQAQRLLLAHTTNGDLTPLFSQFFDTRVGAKTDAVSYEHIAARLTLLPDAVLFVSDVELELDAAAAAGLKTTQIVRPGTRQGTRHPVSLDFSGLSFWELSQPASCPKGSQPVTRP